MIEICVSGDVWFRGDYKAMSVPEGIFLWSAQHLFWRIWRVKLGKGEPDDRYSIIFGDYWWGPSAGEEQGIVKK